MRQATLSDGSLRPSMQELRHRFRTVEWEIEDVVTVVPPVDMMNITGTEEDVETAINRYYANSCVFDPKQAYPTCMITHFGKDFAQNARGIYYHNHFDPTKIPDNRTLVIPSFKDVDWESRSEAHRRRRARMVAEHMVNNETWNKSEYAWEADAWSDIFREMRDDPRLAIDKHEYYANKPKIDPLRCTLTADSSVVKRIPDATFGLATFPKRGQRHWGWSNELRRDRLEKLLLHRKCGLIADPKWGETDLVFPWAVYEAKGWTGDCREARRQACSAAAIYLDMLDHLTRVPGPVGAPKKYQTASSHNYQVFALTSFGAHWHVLVGYRRERQKVEHAGSEGMSSKVYVFQRIWSGRIINERSAWELLSLVDQIHQYAVTTFRDFVLQHLKPWHEFCQESYLFDWDSNYNTGRQRKRKRNCSKDEDLLLPRWVDLVNDVVRTKIQSRAKESLAEALEEEQEYERKLKVIKRIFPSGQGMEDVTPAVKN